VPPVPNSIGALKIQIVQAIQQIDEDTLKNESFDRTRTPVGRLPCYERIVYGAALGKELENADLFLWGTYFTFLPSVKPEL
jgi:hypothetical protein